jgi:hypothetical protein
VKFGERHVKRIGQQLESVLDKALEQVKSCECGEETSCYECLRNYRNQPYHDQLARGPVCTFLEHVIPTVYSNSKNTIS